MMKRKRNRAYGLLLAGCVACVVCGVAGRAWAQDDPLGGADTPDPFGDSFVGSPEDESLGADDFASLLDGLTAEQLEALVKVAARQRLTVEREDVASEIRENLLYDEDEAAQAAAVLSKDPKNTLADNVQRILEAYAIVDVRMAAPWRLYKGKKYAEAAAKCKQRLNPEDATCFSAAMHYLYASALAKSKTETEWPAIAAYSEVLTNFPGRLSFASEAAKTVAETYDRMGRGLYAIEMYIVCLRNYSLTLPKEQVEEIRAKLDALQKVYRDPIGTAMKMMNGVKGRIDKGQVGKDTQAEQARVVALLEDLIKTAEERKKPEKPEKDPEKGEREGEGGKKPGQGEGGKKPGKGQGKPSERKGMAGGKPGGSGAKDSSLAGGKSGRPDGMDKTKGGADSGKWATMPPREREKLENLMRQRLESRRGGLVRDYHKKLAEEN